jgi:hypothetical protein
MGSEDKAPSMADEDHAIRERVRELTSQVLKHGRVDTEAVRDVVRAVTGGVTENPISGDDPGDSFADAVRVLGETVQRSASATHDALQQLASRGSAFTDNDLKEALTSLRALEEAYVAAASRISNAMTGNLRREVVGLATHAQGIGTEASVRLASLMGEFANRMGTAASGLDTVRGAGVRMALLASGVLAGIADALHARPEAKPDQ